MLSGSLNNLAEKSKGMLHEEEKLKEITSDGERGMSDTSERKISCSKLSSHFLVANS